MPSMLGQREDGGDQKRSRLTIILPVVVLIILMTVGFYEINGESLDPRGTDFRIIVTDSMDGKETDFEISTIPVDSLVTVKHLDIDEFDDVKVGDVVAYDFNGRMIVHRVIQNDFENGHFLLKGDNANSTEYIDYDDCIGTVVNVMPTLGKFLSFLKDGPIFIAIIVLCTIGIVLGTISILNILKEKERIE